MQDPTKKWYIHILGKQEGPFTVEEVRQKIVTGELKPDGFAWCQGMKSWDKLGNIEALKALIPSSPAGAINPPAPTRAPQPPTQSPVTPAGPPVSRPPTNKPPAAPAQNSGDLSVMIEFNRTSPEKEEALHPTSSAELVKAKKEAKVALKVSARGRRKAEGLTPTQRLLRIGLVIVALIAALWIYLTLFAAKPGHAAEIAKPLVAKTAPATAAPLSTAPKVERIDVNKIKEKYWTNTEDTEFRVVQNRLYTKSHKFEFGIFAGSVSTDPFLNVRNVGGLISYHLNEYVSLAALGWKDLVNPSSALTTLQQLQNTTASTNNPGGFVGGQAAFSPLYGKLSLLGKSIIYFDTELTAGGGLSYTETGNYITPFIGLGGQVYLTKVITLRLDYRLTAYNEQIRQKNTGNDVLGVVLDNRYNLSDVVTIGLTFLVGPIF